MDLREMIAELRFERDQIDQAIQSLERLALAQPKKRGRPPKWAVKSAGSPSVDQSVSSPRALARGSGTE
jgi:AT-hook transcription factor